MEGAHSGSSPTNLPGQPSKIENGGTTVSGASTVPSLIQQQSFSTQRFAITQFFPITTPAPMTEASTILPVHPYITNQDKHRC